MPASYQGHPVYNIAHLEPYNESEKDTYERPHMWTTWKTFEDLEEYKVEAILDHKEVKGSKGQYICKYHVQWKGYDAKYDTWQMAHELHNTSNILRKYQKSLPPK